MNTVKTYEEQYAEFSEDFRNDWNKFAESEARKFGELWVEAYEEKPTNTDTFGENATIFVFDHIADDRMPIVWAIYPTYATRSFDGRVTNYDFYPIELDQTELSK